MTKRIKDFGAPIGGRRRKKNACILGQDAGDMAGSGRNPGEPYSYMGQADGVGEEKGAYETQKKQFGEPDNRKSRCRIPNWTVYTEPARNIWQTGGMRMKMILRN